ncbi:MFS transporter [Sediminibacillus dalangtanensis]|uniref:MFS transporter n=1 Tax=Sediminibacillus dalangtanensis TaxID=2729421 RepID=A0ABX7VQ26_9BACI|nr:MFS transporter [Sediminibacillus dalangtanensis]QTM98064.1 MFS transporter [Sediminibacillus dalangtanensis]
MNLLWTNRNFLLLFIGRIVTNIGDSIYYVAAMWLVYDLGGSAFYSGLAGFLTLLPTALQFFTGPFVDKWPIKKVLVFTQLLQCLLILIIPMAHWLGFLTVHLILIIMPLVAFIEQFAYPSQTKALVHILSRQQLVKGNSLFAFAYQGIDLLFNAVSGILVAIVGAVSLYLADSMTFALAALLFTMCKLPWAEEKKKEKASIKQTFLDYKTELKQGFSLVFRSLLASFLIGSVVCNFAIGAGLAVLPSLGAELGGAEIYGFYLAAMSTGSLLGALTSTFFGRFPVGKLSILTFFFGSCCWVASTFLSPVLLGAVLFGLAWVPVGATNVLFAAVMQSVVPLHLLGRVNTVSRSMSASAMPIGSLAGGYLASAFSPSLIFSCAGVGLLIVTIVWLCHSGLRQLPKSDEMTAETFDLPTDMKENRAGSNL